LKTELLITLNLDVTSLLAPVLRLAQI